jgi:hypothetical protein
VDESPRFVDAKGAAMPGFMFMVKSKEVTNAPTLKIMKAI